MPFEMYLSLYKLNYIVQNMQKCVSNPISIYNCLFFLAIILTLVRLRHLASKSRLSPQNHRSCISQNINLWSTDRRRIVHTTLIIWLILLPYHFNHHNSRPNWKCMVFILINNLFIQDVYLYFKNYTFLMIYLVQVANVVPHVGFRRQYC
jgi:hypothetical protein